MAPETETDIVDDLLADLGNLVRRSRFQQLTEEDFEEIARRMRTNLKILQAQRLGLLEDPPHGSLADGVARAGAWLRARPDLARLVMPPARLTVIDGGKAGEPRP